MGSRLALVGSLPLYAALASGCAHTLESRREDRIVIAEDTKSFDGSAASAGPAPLEEPVQEAPRRRLSRTVTLGEGTIEPVGTMGAPPQVAQGPSGPNVVVNNNITVVNSPPVVYGGYGGYSGSYGRSSGSSGFVSRGELPRGSSSSAWAPSGWEGAGRTAAPGQTPHVGGNWASPPSHGPRQLK